MKQFHNFLLNYWIIILVIFAILTYFFDQQNKQVIQKVTQFIEQEKQNENPEYQFFEDKKIGPQIFTGSISFQPLQKEKWDKWQAILTQSDAQKNNTRSFILDCIWAVFFVAVIYLLGNIGAASFSPIKRSSWFSYSVPILSMSLKT